MAETWVPDLRHDGYVTGTRKVTRQYLRQSTAEVVLSIALGRLDKSSRFKDVAHPAPAEWMHHLEIRQLGDLDDEVADWLREAAERAW